MSTTKSGKNVGARVTHEQYAALEQLAAATGVSLSGALSDLAPSAELASVLALEASVAGGIGQAQERLVADGLIARMQRCGAIDHGSETLAMNPPFVFGIWRRYLEAVADEIAPDRKGIGDMLTRLRSDDPNTRLWAGIGLANTLGAEMQGAGAAREEAEMGVGRDLSDLIGKAMSGDVAAVDKLEAAIADGVHTRVGVAEPSARARELAALNSTVTLLELAAVEKDRAAREDLLAALFLRIGSEASPTARQRIGGLVSIADQLAAGSSDAFTAAHRWIVQNILTEIEA